jgi:hypothetical protein
VEGISPAENDGSLRSNVAFRIPNEETLRKVRHRIRVAWLQ